MFLLRYSEIKKRGLSIKVLNPKTHNVSFVFLLFTIAAAYQVGTDLYLPAFPEMTRSFGSDNTNVQLSLTAFLMGTFLFQLIYGPLSDRYGRKNILLVGLGVASVASILPIYATHIYQLIILRFVQGSGIGACALLTRVILRDLYGLNAFAQKVSFINVGIAFIPAVAPIIGSYALVLMGWKGCFVVLSAYYMSLFLLILVFLPETHSQEKRISLHSKTVFKNYIDVLMYKPFLAYSMCSGLTFAGWVAYVSSAPFLFQVKLSMSPVKFAWLLLILAFSKAIASFINGILVKKAGIHRMIRLGLVMLLSSGLFFTVCGIAKILNVFVLLCGGALYAVGASFIYSNVKAGAFDPFPNKAGTLGALYGGMQIGLCSLSSLLIAFLPEQNTLVLGALFLILPLFSLLVLWGLTDFK